MIRIILLALSVSAAIYAADPTFNKDILPIFQNRCQECHRAGEIGPMPLMTYQDARPWAKSIKAAVLQGKMPPWPADSKHGKFANDRSLAKEQVDLIAAWVDSGAKEGDAKDKPRPRQWVQGWNIATPDHVIEMPVAFDVPAKGEVEYQYVIVPTGFSEDKWVRMVEVRPSNRSVVHHAVMFIREPGGQWLKDAKPGVPFAPPVSNPGQRFLNTNGGGNDILTIYTPGMVPDIWKPGQAKQIKAGSDIIFQMHYTANGKAGADKTRIGLVYAKEPPTERIITVAAVNNRFVIPPGDPNFSAPAVMPVNNSMTIISLFPHLHLRGKAFQYEVIQPSGEAETILKVNNWSLNWQLSYKLEKPIRLDPGMRVRATAWWDNSPNNPANPDPKAEVRWGEQSWEEMHIGFLDVAVHPEINNRNIMSRRQTSGAQ